MSSSLDFTLKKGVFFHFTRYLTVPPMSVLMMCITMSVSVNLWVYWRKGKKDAKVRLVHIQFSNCGLMAWALLIP